jgi:hypothetical protein
MAALFSISENGFTPGGLLLADCLLCDRDTLLINAPTENFLLEDSDFFPYSLEDPSSKEWLAQRHRRQTFSYIVVLCAKVSTNNFFALFLTDSNSASNLAFYDTNIKVLLIL